MPALFVLLQHLLPQHTLSRLAGWLAGCRVAWLKNTLIRWFIRRYRVDLSQAAINDVTAFRDFNDFFTRRLKDGARPLAQAPDAVLCPADGMISELGLLQGDRVLQAKGRTYSLAALLGGDPADSEPFLDGSFITIYLSPRDYHRVHMPVAGQLRRTIHVPGRLFSVNQATVNGVTDLFARNERLICFFDTEFGPMAQVLVGAMIVAGIDTVWAGQVPTGGPGATIVDYSGDRLPVQLAQGEEMGLFRLGSTVITLFGPGAVRFENHWQAGDTVQMGIVLGRRSPQS
ncbi:MAG: phosphatidylserine decarboxylase [Pseudomonadota bacterium]